MHVAKKVGEEGVEAALAAMAKNMDELTCESADLLYHLTVLLQNEGLQLSDIAAKLQELHNKLVLIKSVFNLQPPPLFFKSTF